jgi:ribosomal protein S18 acetylase RimI-like enzyme
MQNMKMRNLEPEENEQAISLMRSAINARCGKFYGEHTIRKWTAVDNAQFKFQIPKRVFCVANDAGPVSIVGWRAGGEGGCKDMEGTARISVVYTHPDYAGQGIGRQLMRMVEDDIQRAGFTHIALYATMNAVRFYRQVGFEDRGDQLLEVANGHYITIRRMVKNIHPEFSDVEIEII